MIKKVILASSNAHKIDELTRLCKGRLEIISMRDTGIIEEIEETGSTLIENALLKARYVFEKTKIPVIADDSGLEIIALKGEPGVYSARYAGKEKNDEANIQKVLKNMEGITDRRASFKTILAYKSESEELIFEGKMEGNITFGKSGNNGFGYDSIFIPLNREKTFAEMETTEKNGISHRSEALKKLLHHFSIL